jgi:hypothetical protein
LLQQESYATLKVLNIIDWQGGDRTPYLPAIQALTHSKTGGNEYVKRMTDYLLNANQGPANGESGAKHRRKGQFGSNSVSACYLNLRQIQLAKYAWASDEKISDTNVPTWGDLRPHLQLIFSNGIPVCPAGGTYGLHRVDQDPTCSVGGAKHSLPH